MAEAASARNPPVRYWIAGIIGTVVLVLLVATSILDYLQVSEVAGQVYMLSLPALALIVLGGYIAFRARRLEGVRRRRQMLRAGIYVGMSILVWLLAVDIMSFTRSTGALVSAKAAAACLPTTALGLWVVRSLDRNDRLPWSLTLLAAAWGAIVATSLVVWANTLLARFAVSHLVPGPGLEAVTAYGAGVFEELAKGLAVLLLYLVVRTHFSGIIDGIVYGAAVGLGFNLMESILYITHMYEIFAPDGQGYVAVFQWYHRQVLGLFLGHATFTALLGAGVGVARQVPQPSHKVMALAAGWLAAVAAHFAWDAWYAFFPISNTQFAMFEIHLRTVIMVGPFTALVLLLLAMGQKVERNALRRHLRQEMELHLGTVYSAEVPILLSPSKRLQARLRTLWRAGRPSHSRLRQLQAAQIRLGMARWHAERGELADPEQTVAQLRALVIAIRGGEGRRVASPTIRLRPATVRKPLEPGSTRPEPPRPTTSAPIPRGH
jgi:RsiW-degrading membrane proteinase PrsW (M82 family)